jgi:hypothetical protein
MSTCDGSPRQTAGAGSGGTDGSLGPANAVGWAMSILMLVFPTLWCLVFGSAMPGWFSFFGAWASAFPR